MEIRFDDATMQATIQEHVAKAIAESFGDYNVRGAIRDSVTKQVVEGVLAKAMTTAVEQIDIDGLTTALAKELAKASAASVVLMLRSFAAEALYKIRGHSDYGQDKERTMAAIRKELEDVVVIAPK